MKTSVVKISPSFARKTAYPWGLNTRPARIFFAVTACLLFCLSASGLNGFSLTKLHDVIDSSPHSEDILGKSRGVRSDDWVATLPMALSQIQLSQPFSVVNDSIGTGQNVLVAAPVMPVLHPSVVAKPLSWGYFVSPKVGIAWHWWFQFFGLLASAFASFMIFSSGAFWVSLLIAAAFLFSPFVQFWSLNCAHGFIMFFSSHVFFSFVIHSEKTRTKLCAAIALGVSGAGLILFLYPPAQVSLGYIFLALAAGSVWEKLNQSQRYPGQLPKMLALLSLSGIIVAFLVASFWFSAQDTISALGNTVYPGKRFVTGGGSSLLKVFSNLVLSPELAIKIPTWGNICEAASFFYFLPLTMLMPLLAGWKKIRAVSWHFWLPFTLSFLFLCWSFVSFGETFAKFSLLRFVPPFRLPYALGVLNSFLLLYSLRENEIWLEVGIKRKLAIALAWLVFISYLCVQATQTFSSIQETSLVYSLGAITTCLGLLLVFRATLFAPLFLVFSILSTIWFNPLSLDISAYLQGNPLANAMKETARQKPDAHWVVYGSLALASYPKVLGLKTLNGVHYSPHFALWKHFDPTGKYKEAYNRYAHVLFQPSPEVTLASPQQDVLVAKIPPNHIGLRDLGVRFILATADTGDLTAYQGVKRLQCIGTKCIYEVKWSNDK